MKLPRVRAGLLLRMAMPFSKQTAFNAGEILDVLGSLLRDLIVLSDRSAGHC